MKNQSLFKGYENAFDGQSEEKPKAKKREKFFAYSPFALQDAIGERDVKKIWIEYQRLRLSGVEPEDLIHKIASKAKEMAAIKKGASREDLDMKSDYPYNKSKRGLKNWGAGELEAFYTRIVEIYHRSRMSGEDLDLALERTLLKIL